MLTGTRTLTTAAAAPRGRLRAVVAASMVAFTASVGVVATTAPAHACSCVSDMSMKQKVKAADLVVLAHLEQVRTPEANPEVNTEAASDTPTDVVEAAGPAGVDLQVVVSRVWKGEVPQARMIVSAEDGCVFWPETDVADATAEAEPEAESPTSTPDPADLESETEAPEIPEDRLLLFVTDGATSACDGSAPATDASLAALQKVEGRGDRVDPPPPAEVTFTATDDTEPADFARTAAPGAAMALLGLLGLGVVRRLQKD